MLYKDRDFTVVDEFELVQFLPWLYHRKKTKILSPFAMMQKIVGSLFHGPFKFIFQTLQIDSSFSLQEMKEENPGEF